MCVVDESSADKLAQCWVGFECRAVQCSAVHTVGPGDGTNGHPGNVHGGQSGFTKLGRTATDEGGEIRKRKEWHATVCNIDNWLNLVSWS